MSFMIHDAQQTLGERGKLVALYLDRSQYMSVVMQADLGT
jgi:predicted nucleic acid-binding Zn finger protein